MTLTADHHSRAAQSVEGESALRAKLSEPGVAQSLGVLLEHADLIAVLVQSLDEFVRRGDSVTEAIAEIVGEAKRTVISDGAIERLGDLDPAALARSLVTVSRLLPTVTPVLTQAVESGAISTFLESEIVSQPVIRQLSMVANAAVAAADETASGQQPPLTLKATFKAMRDDDVQRGLGFAVAALRNIGRSVAANSTQEATQSSSAATDQSESGVQ